MSKSLFFSNFKDWQLNYLSCDLCLVPSASKGKAAELYLRIKSKTFDPRKAFHTYTDWERLTWGEKII